MIFQCQKCCQFRPGIDQRTNILMCFCHRHGTGIGGDYQRRQTVRVDVACAS